MYLFFVSLTGGPILVSGFFKVVEVSGPYGSPESGPPKHRAVDRGAHLPPRVGRGPTGLGCVGTKFNSHVVFENFAISSGAFPM